MAKRLYTLLVVGSAVSCMFGCKAKEEPWVRSHDVVVMAMCSQPENGKEYLQIYYQNTGADTIEKIKYELIKLRGSKVDTTEKIIEPEKLLEPKEEHVQKREVGQPPIDFDAVNVGKIWVIKKSS